ncbi:hypothetical protein [Nonomuraea sp. NEAU-A123]|uniref:hypothetical protein n=1 Tax=Nonomuraea sp. NEAU-A123 TaxID=2839649 RepID=UPI001BE45DF3|nr:hypothetical protein [Nonomuraea sp. NEAU-A123]MBT2226256.1 hypothetical protein [Nonomuraea sp. NEAU-A123]
MHAPLYMTPPCGDERIVDAMLAGDLGMITTPAQGNRPIPGVVKCRDNGVFGGHYRGDEAYLAGLDELAAAGLADEFAFVVAPDVVGNHWATKNASWDMLPRIRERGFSVAFVAQPGIEYDAWDLWNDIDALFIGGGDDWKESAAVAELVDIANSLGKWTHMGRVNTWGRYLIAARMGVDSVDGTMCTVAPKNVERIMRWRDRILAAADVDALFGVDEPAFEEVNGFNPDRPGRHRGRFTSARPAAEVDQLSLFAA